MSNTDVLDMHFKKPDKYKTLKISFSQILKNNNKDLTLSIINDALFRVNKIVIHTYQFLRLFNLSTNQIIGKDDKFLELTVNVIGIAMKLFIKTTKRGRKIVGKNKDIYNEFKNFFDEHYSPYFKEDKIDGQNLSSILNYCKTSILTAIENNIKIHFVDYLNRFVNCSFKPEHEKILEKFKGKERDDVKYKLKAELKILKNDIISGTYTYNSKYENWMMKWGPQIVPNLLTNKSHIHNLNENPQHYLVHMKKMSSEIIKMGYKSFQYFPLRTECIPKYIKIDTKALVELLVNVKNMGVDKGYIYDNLTSYKKEIWNKFFNMKHKIFKQNKYVFNYEISTDGYAISILFLHKDNVETENLKKENKKKGLKIARLKYSKLDREEIDELKEKKRQNVKIYKSKTEFKKEAKEDFKNKNKEDQENIKKKMTENKKIKLPYLEELEEKEIEILKEQMIAGKVVYVDPGKKNILYMMNNEGRYFRYTISERLYETGRIKYRKNLQNYKNYKGISEIENELSGYNSKSCEQNEFKKYIEKKNELNEALTEKYKADIFRKYKWFGFINTQRSEAKLMEKIKKVYGKDITVIYGDWSIGQQMRNFIPTPIKGIKKLITENFKTYSIDEYKTSAINYKTQEKNENMYIVDKKGALKKQHSILTYKMENERKGCINRDKCAVNNFDYITKYFLEKRERPEVFKREKTTDQNKIKKQMPKRGKEKKEIKKEIRKDKNKNEKSNSRRTLVSVTKIVKRTKGNECPIKI